MGMILTALFAVISANALWELLSILVSGIVGEKEKDMSDKYVTLDEFMNEQGDYVKQVVYKVDGDFVGDIKGDNVTVILMGDGDFVGDIDSPNGEVVLIRGSIDGDVKANKIICPTKPTEQKHKATCESCLYYVDINQHYYWCTQGRCMGRCSKNNLDICENYRTERE